MKLPIQRRRRTLEEIHAVAERYWKSGLTQRAFAPDEGVCVATLAKYLRLAVEPRPRLAGFSQADTATLVKVRRQAPGPFAAPFADDQIRISLLNGTALEMATSGRELGSVAARALCPAMIGPGPSTRVFLALGATDMRKGFDGLFGLVHSKLREDPFSGHLEHGPRIPFQR